MKNKSVSENIEFKNKQGLSLSARMDLPDGNKVKAYAIFSHCFTCSKHFKAAAYISRGLASLGFGVLRFDFAGIGDSQGIFQQTNFSTNVADVVAAAGYMEEQKMAPDLLIGHSFGGTAVLRAAAEIPSASAVVTIGSPADPDHIIRLVTEQKKEIEERGETRLQIGNKNFTITKQFLDDVAAAQVSKRLHRLNKALLVLHSPLDGTVGIENAGTIFQAARHPKSFVALAGADHLLTEREDADYAARIIDVWAGRFLGRGVFR